MKKTSKLLLVLSLAVLFAVSTFALVACNTTVEPKLDVTVSNNVDVKVGDSLDSVKQYLTVKYTDSNGKTSAVTSYELQGTITEGQTTLTVKYQGLTATCKITVKANAQQGGNDNPNQGGNDNPNQGGDNPTKPTVTVELNGGTMQGSFIVRDNGILIAPMDPQKNNNYFVGWCKDEQCYNLWNFETDKAAQDLTLYAKWKAIVETNGLEFVLNSSRINYSVKGIGNVTAKEIVIPSVYNGKPVTEIGDLAFVDCRQLVSIVIPNSITTIRNSAFRNCTSLKSLVIPDSVTRLEEYALNGCSSLESLTLPYIGNRMQLQDGGRYPLGFFFGEIDYPGAVAVEQHFLGYASRNTKTTYFIPKSLKRVTITGGTISPGAFYNCSGLSSIVIGDNVTGFDTWSFDYCGMTSIVIGSGVKTAYGFYECRNLSEIIYNGTIQQWKNISKQHYDTWYQTIVATKVICSDGEVALY